MLKTSITAALHANGAHLLLPVLALDMLGVPGRVQPELLPSVLFSPPPS